MILCIIGVISATCFGMTWLMVAKCLRMQVKRLVSEKENFTAALKFARRSGANHVGARALASGGL